MNEEEALQFGLDHEISPQLPVVKELRAIKNAVIALAEKEQPEPEKRPEVQKISFDGINVVTLKGDKGDTPKVGIDFEQPKDGENYILTEKDKKEIASKIVVPVVEKVVEKIEVLQPIVTNEIREVAVADTAEQVRDKLASLEDDERLDASAIKGLREQFEALSNQISSIPRGGGSPRGDVLKVDDLTSYTDGSTKTFYLEKAPKNLNVVKVWGSDFPFIMTHGKGFTITGKLLTLADDVDSPLQGAKLVCEYTI